MYRIGGVVLLFGSGVVGMLYFGTDLGNDEFEAINSALRAFPHPTTTAGWALSVATLSLFSLIGLFSQLGETRRRFRADVAPYLRVDLSPFGPAGSWAPPVDRIGSDLTFADLNPDEAREASALDSWSGDIPIYLWVENRQTGSAGIADNVQVEVELEFPDRSDPETLWRVTSLVRFSYLEAGHLNRYEIARVDQDIPFITGAVTEIRYETMFRRYSTWGHGSAAFSFRNGHLLNERVAFRQREGWLGRLYERRPHAWRG